MNIAPITCWRPIPDNVASWIDRRIDSLSASQAVDELRTAAASGTLLRDDTAALYVWRISDGKTTWSGVVAAVATDDVDACVAIPHVPQTGGEGAALLEHMQATEAQITPVVIAYPKTDVVDQLVVLASMGEPIYAFLDSAGRHHTVWRVVRTMAVEALVVTLGQVGEAKLVAGEDAAMAALSLRELRLSQGVEVGAANAVLCLLVPNDAATAHISIPSGLFLRRI